MSASIRGHQGALKVFENGAQVDVIAITRVDVNQDSTFMRSFYVGNPLPEGDQTVEGWSGSVEAEVKNAVQDEFIDRLISANQAGIGVADYTFIHTENYADGTSKSYVYFDVQWKLSKSQAGLNEKMTRKLDFQASGRLAL